MALALAALVAALAAVGHWLHGRQVAEVRGRAQADLVVVRDVEAAHVAAWFRDQPRDAALLAGSGLLRPLVAGEAGAGAALAPLLGMFRESNDYQAVLVVDAGGRVLLAVPRRAPLDAASRRLARQARGGAVAFADVRTLPGGREVVEWAVPLPTAGGGRATLHVRCGVAGGLAGMLERWPRLRQGEALLGTRQGDAVRVISRARLAGAGGGGEVVLPLSNREAPLVRAARGGSGAGPGVDYRGVPVLAAWGQVPGTPWFIVAKQDLAAVDAPLRTAALALYGALAALGALVVAVVALLVRSRQAEGLRRLVAEERRRRAAEELLARERDLLAAGPMVTFRWAEGEAGVVEYVSPNVTALGFTPGEFLSGRRTYADVIHPDDRAWVVADGEARERNGLEAWTQEYRIIDGQGRVRWVRDYTRVVRREDGGVECYEGYVIDISAEKAAEAALRESEERYRALFDGLADAAFVMTDRFVECNAAAAAMFGLPRERLLGARPADVSPPRQPDGRPSQEAADERIRAALAGRPQRFAWRHRRGDGSEFDADVTLAPVSLGGEPHVLALVRDVSEREAQRRELAAARARLDALVAAAPLPVVVLDADGRVTEWNVAAEAVFGWPRDEVLGRRPPFLADEAGAELDEWRARAAAGEVLSGLLLTCGRRDGLALEASVSLAPLAAADDGHADEVVAVFDDVTERRATARRLARISGMYQALGSVAELVARGRPPAEVLAALPALLAGQGTFRAVWVFAVEDDRLVPSAAGGDESLSAAVLAGHPHLLAGADCPAAVAVRERRPLVVADLAAAPAVAAHLGLEPAQAVASLVAVPVLPARPGASAAAAIVAVSERPGAFDPETVALVQHLGEVVGVGLEAERREAARREAERRLASLNVELEERVRERTAALGAANRELEAFAYSVSHDLRAPLRALDGFSLALLEDYGEVLDASGKDYLRRIRAASQRMATLIDDLLTLSRVSRHEVAVGDVDLSEVARRVVAELRASEPGRRVRVRVAAGLGVRGDPHLLEVALRNLLDNVWKFTRGREEARISVGARRRGGETVYYVRDNGAGFDMRYADKLFAPFQRLHDAAEYPGTGIGLATVQRIIERHGGRVWAEGEPGRGATFFFTLASDGGT